MSFLTKSIMLNEEGIDRKRETVSWYAEGIIRIPKMARIEINRRKKIVVRNL